MLRSLLVPLDGSDLSEWSLPIATRVARATGACLHLARVHEPHEPDHLLSNSSFQWEGVDLHEYDGRHRENESEYLAGVTGRLDGDGIAVDARLLDGDPAERLASYADEVDSDLVVITSHGRSGLQRAWLGSVADGMVRRTHRPLLILHPHDAEAGRADLDIRHILVPLDGSGPSESVLPAALDLALATGARVTLVHVLAGPTVLGPRIMTYRPDRLEPDLGGAFKYLDAVAEDLRYGGVEVAVQARTGAQPAVAIADAAKELDADIIAMATHGYGMVKRTVLGSVADKVLRLHPVPLLLVRERLEA